MGCAKVPQKSEGYKISVTLTNNRDVWCPWRPVDDDPASDVK